MGVDVMKLLPSVEGQKSNRTWNELIGKRTKTEEKPFNAFGICKRDTLSGIVVTTNSSADFK